MALVTEGSPTNTLTLGGGRVIATRYDDPLNLVWLHCAARLGMTVVRSREVYAAWDGKGTLTIADERDFDADDCLAQLIFHEICHALIAGPEAWTQPDWGLCNRDDRDLSSEHATHRLQAALADRHGLRRFMGPTTEHRPYYDALPSDALALVSGMAAASNNTTVPSQGPSAAACSSAPVGDGAGPAKASWDEAIVAAALAGWERATSSPWAEPIEDALVATAAMARVLGSAATAGTLWSGVAAPGEGSDCGRDGVADPGDGSGP